MPTRFAEALVTIIIPTNFTSIPSLAVHVCFAVKANSVRKQLEREKTFRECQKCGDSSRRVALKREQSNIRGGLKQITALLVVVLGNMLIIVLINLVYFLVRFLVNAQSYCIKISMNMLLLPMLHMWFTFAIPLCMGYFSNKPVSQCWHA